MSRQGVEGVLWRLVTDAVFRERFAIEPAITSSDCRLDLTADELAAFMPFDPHVFETIANLLDPQISGLLDGHVRGRAVGLPEPYDPRRPRLRAVRGGQAQ